MRRYRSGVVIALLVGAMLLAAVLLETLIGAIIKLSLDQMPVVTVSPSPEPEQDYAGDIGRAAGFTD